MSVNNPKVSAHGLSRGPLCVRMTLENVLYISYGIPADDLRPLVPDILPLATRGDGIAFVSLVAFRSANVRLTFFPLIRFNYNQFNIRTYVIDPVSGQPAVYFIRSGVTSRIISVVNSISGIPWQFIKVTEELNNTGDHRELSISGNWGNSFSIEAWSAGGKEQALEYFGSKKPAVDFLIRPLIGYIKGNSGVSRFTIRHSEVDPENWTLQKLNVPLFNKLVAVKNIIEPHSVFYLNTADFSIFLPPAKIKKG
jgi:hypothetical protein